MNPTVLVSGYQISRSQRSQIIEIIFFGHFSGLITMASNEYEPMYSLFVQQDNTMLYLDNRGVRTYYNTVPLSILLYC